MRKRLGNWVLGALLAVGVAFAPAAFARGHVSVGVGINLPGLSIGFSDCRHCGRGYGWAGNYGYGGYYAGGYYGGGYYGGGYGGYYMPAYYYTSYPVAYGPAWYGAGYYDDYGPSYYRVRAPRVVQRTYDGDHYRGDYGHRGRYYDRDGYYRR